MGLLSCLFSTRRNIRIATTCGGKKKGRLITKIPPLKLQKGSDPPSSNKPATVKGPLQWTWALSFGIHNRTRYLIEFRVHTRSLRHLSNFYLRDDSSMWVSSNNRRVVCSSAGLEKLKVILHSITLRLTSSPQTWADPQVSLSLSENDKCLGIHRELSPSESTMTNKPSGDIHTRTHVRFEPRKPARA